jgi:hypothetical protein
MTQMLSRAIGIAIVGARTSRIQVGFGSWIRNDSDAYQGNRHSDSWREDEQNSGGLWKLDKE